MNFAAARQDLTNERNAIIRFHRLDLHIHIDIAGTEQQLARRRSHMPRAGHHRLIIGVEHKRSEELPQTTGRLGSTKG